MIRPSHFSPNSETAADNAFQQPVRDLDRAVIAKAAYEEVTLMASELERHGVRTHLFDDKATHTPDSVFPNNWFSTHPGGHIALYPMFAHNRRHERRNDILTMLKQNYRVQDIIDYSGLEQDQIFLEGTGAMVLDHIDRVAYAVKSNRTNPIALERFCTHFNYEPMVFDAMDANDTPIYHTNVLMCVATNFAMIGLDMISNSKRRHEITQRLEETGRTVIALTNEQIANFAGNAIELNGQDGLILALSSRAYKALTPQQLSIIEENHTLLPLNIPTIEMAGGSIRCMIAGIHLSMR